MHMQLTNKNDSAWSKGDQAYALDDTLETGVLKAQKEGYRPGSNGYAAFITAFSRRVRSKEVGHKEVGSEETPLEKPAEKNIEATATLRHVATASASASAVIFTPDFLRIVP